MQSDITKFIGRKSQEENLIGQFAKMVRKAKDKNEIRKLEMRLLRPKPIEAYKGPRPGKSNFKKKCITLTFPSTKQVAIWAKYFKVNTYIENNTYDVAFLIELFNLMEQGLIEWKEKEKKFIFPVLKDGKLTQVPKLRRKIKRRKK
jgi:hypothetical protein